MPNVNYLKRAVWDDVTSSYYAVPEGTTVDDLTGGLIRTGVLDTTYDEDDDPVFADLPDTFVDLGDDWDEACRILALRHSLDEWDGYATVSDKTVSLGRGDWLVVTDDEADELWNASLESYLDDCVLAALPEIARNYFDREAWKKDARIDGRAQSLATYDGDEDYIDLHGYETLYVYRTN